MVKNYSEKAKVQIVLGQSHAMLLAVSSAEIAPQVHCPLSYKSIPFLGWGGSSTSSSAPLFWSNSNIPFLHFKSMASSNL